MLKPGMPVVYLNRSGTPVAHVLIERQAEGWVVAGVNNTEVDDDLVTPRNLVGMVRCAYAAVGQNQVSTVATVATAIRERSFNRFAALTW
jgi:hypothetical protein